MPRFELEKKIMFEWQNDYGVWFWREREKKKNWRIDRRTRIDAMGQQNCTHKNEN